MEPELPDSEISIELSGLYENERNQRRAIWKLDNDGTVYWADSNDKFGFVLAGGVPGVGQAQSTTVNAEQDMSAPLLWPLRTAPRRRPVLPGIPGEAGARETKNR